MNFIDPSIIWERERKAVRENNKAELKRVSRRTWESIDRDGWTLFTYSASLGCLAALHLAVQSGVNVDRTDMRGRTALHVASGAGHVTCAMYLTLYGASLWVMDTTFSRPRDLAARQGHQALAQWLDQTAAAQITSHGSRSNKKDESKIRHRFNTSLDRARAGESEGEGGSDRRGMATRRDSLYGGVTYSSYSLCSQLSGVSMKSKLDRQAAAAADPLERLSSDCTTSFYLSDPHLQSVLHPSDTDQNCDVTSLKSDVTSISHQSNKSRGGVAKKILQKNKREQNESSFQNSGLWVKGGSRSNSSYRNTDQENLKRLNDNIILRSPVIEQDVIEHQSKIEVSNLIEVSNYQINQSEKFSNDDESESVDRSDEVSMLARLDSIIEKHKYGIKEELIEILICEGMSEYLELMNDERLDISSVALITDKDLKHIGLPSSPRRQILSALRKRHLNCFNNNGDIQVNNEAKYHNIVTESTSDNR